MKQIIVRSWVSMDGYQFEGKSYDLSPESLAELREKIKGEEVEFVAGLNTFAGEPVSAKYVELMKNRLLGQN